MQVSENPDSDIRVILQQIQTEIKKIRTDIEQTNTKIEKWDKEVIPATSHS